MAHVDDARLALPQPVQLPPPAPIAPQGELRRLLSPDGEHDAIRLLRRYFTPMPAGTYTGAHFERFAGGGDRLEGPEDDPRIAAHVFDSHDLVAVSMLSVNIRGAAALEILEHRAERLTTLLMRIPFHVRLAAVPTDVIRSGWADVRGLYAELRSIPSIGPTTATKLMARKRPHLVPILDSVIARELKIVRGQYWDRLHAWLTADGGLNDTHLRWLREDAGLAPQISNLRVFDVLAWMVGSGHADRSDVARTEEWAVQGRRQSAGEPTPRALSAGIRRADIRRTLGEPL
jgi:hypothetical protein